MGHQAHLKEEYRSLVERLEAGPVGLPEPRDPEALAGWREILEILYSPEEAALAACLPLRPASLGTIASRVGQDPESLRPRLEAMADRGLVLDLLDPESGKTRYLLAPPVVGFFEFSMMRARDSIPKKRLALALEAYCHGDDTFVTEVFGQETVLGRAMVHEDALDPETLPEVLDWERASRVVDEARVRAVSLCYCRHKQEHLGRRCETPMEICLSLDGGAEYVLRHGLGRPAEQAEARDILAESRRRGLVQIADNVMHRPSWICNCCGCCCGQLAAINQFGLAAVNPSGFEASPHEDRCNGCSRCARACPIAAVRMEPRRLDAQMKNTLVPRVDADRCLGCGVCATACTRGAIEMKRRAAPRDVPRNAVERVIRQCLERGRLAHLLFDQGASRGSRFLNRAVQVMCRLPLADRVLASRQLQSRFVDFAMGLVPDPERDSSPPPSRTQAPPAC